MLDSFIQNFFGGWWLVVPAAWIALFYLDWRDKGGWTKTHTHAALAIMLSIILARLLP